MAAILQDSLRVAPWMEPKLARLPGIQPVAPGDWLQVDEAYSAQLAEKARLLRGQAHEVCAVSDGARPAARELLARVLADLAARGEFLCAGDQVTRPDGVSVRLDAARPLHSLSQLVQEDFCILQKQGDEHILTAALLCFPASWTLSEKFLRPLTLIHGAVESYDAGIAARVQRLLDNVRPDQPLWRANALAYDDPALYQPRRAIAPRQAPKRTGRYIRSERQTLVRLPETEAVVFSIHTTQVVRAALTAAQADGLERHLCEAAADE